MIKKFLEWLGFKPKQSTWVFPVSEDLKPKRKPRTKLVKKVAAKAVAKKVTKVVKKAK